MMKKWMFAATVLVASPAMADTFRIAYNEGGDAPFVMLDKRGPRGIFPDLMSAIVKLSGDKLEQRYLPMRRLLKSFEDGQLDIEVGANPKWRSSSLVPGVYSIAFGLPRAVLCFRPGETPKAQAVTDFYGQKVGVISGYSYPEFEAAFASGKIQREDIFNSPNLLLTLRAKRFDQIIISNYVRQYWTKVDAQRYACDEGRMIDESEMMLRVHPSKADALPRLNAAIATLKKSGELDAIFRRYSN
ncbi:MAG: transporter substrate-binding domain-containing protein [Burkholderiales bacterium]|nr:transporter substrate-binding domain-containing protein [Burkholderiales bacterium]